MTKRRDSVGDTMLVKNLIAILMESPLYLEMPIKERLCLVKFLAGKYEDICEQEVSENL
jgi:hypothetical protein